MGYLKAHIYLLRCHCGRRRYFKVEVFPGDDSIGLLIRAAKKQGWKFRAEQGDKLAHDLCPKHSRYRPRKKII